MEQVKESSVPESQIIDPEQPIQLQQDFSLSQVEMVESTVIKPQQESVEKKEEEQKKEDDEQVEQQQQQQEQSQPSQQQQPLPSLAVSDINQSLMNSNMTTGDLRFSVSEVQVNENLEAYLRSYKPDQIGTRIIVKEEQEVEEDDDEENKKQKEKEQDSLYFMSYFKWYWDRYGFFTAFKDFFYVRLRDGLIYNVFYGIGLSIGTFFFKRLLRIRFGLGQYLQ